MLFGRNNSGRLAGVPAAGLRGAGGASVFEVGAEVGPSCFRGFAGSLSIGCGASASGFAVGESSLRGSWIGNGTLGANGAAGSGVALADSVVGDGGGVARGIER